PFFFLPSPRGPARPIPHARPELCPLVLAISPASSNCFSRRRSSLICTPGSWRNRPASHEPSLPPGGSYFSSTRTTVPRLPVAGSKCPEPAVATREPSSDRQAISRPLSSLTISASHDTVVPAGPRATQCERLPSSFTSTR